jgi:hypothetical protein
LEAQATERALADWTSRNFRDFLDAVIDDALRFANGVLK